MQTLTQVACTVCGCVCDDLRVTIADDRIVGVEPFCSLAEPWFLQQNTFDAPAARIDGNQVPFAAAIDHSVQLLRSARAPLIFGLARSTTEGQRAAIALAEYVGGCIDTSAASGHAPSLMALQQVGESTCSLGEVKNRADLIIYWRSNPLATHPRHRERYLGRTVNRHIVCVDVKETESGRVADQLILIEPNQEWPMLWTLRGLIMGLVQDAPPVWIELAQRMKTCRCGIIFFGIDLAKEPLGHRKVEALLQLVTDLNAHTRFYARRMRRYGDVAGAESVLTWQTGDPFAVQFGRGYPRYNPGEYSAPAMLAREEVDLCLLVGSESALDLPEDALDHLRQIPVLVLDSPGAEPNVPAAVQFTTAVYGVHRPGTAYRMDEIPIPLRTLLTTEYPSDGEVLDRLLQELKK